MPQIKKIQQIILKPLLEEHNKIVNIIDHLDHELASMIEESDPDTAFVEISIVLLNNYINRYHTIEADVISHFDQHELNLEEKLKVMTLFNEHRESLPLLEKLNKLQANLIEDNTEVSPTLIEIRDTCDTLHAMLHKIGKKYFANILIDNHNHVIAKKKSGRISGRRELELNGEIICGSLDDVESCKIINISDEGLSIITKLDHQPGEKISIRCDMGHRPLLNCEVAHKSEDDGMYTLGLRILNVAEWDNIVYEFLNGDTPRSS